MECNKDEATRAKEIAERKFIAKDISGAKNFALKAQKLFPSLEGIPQMIAKIDVYISAENKVKGEVDWYGILGVDPCADDDTVRKHYRKRALMLHPDKNKSIGADGAFKFISEAWSILSDKARRAAYDEKINAKAQKGSTIFGGSSAKVAANDEATRAKEISERKFIAKDIWGAKKFALKAQNLYPSLEGIPQMIAKIDVYISAENKVKGEADLYGILGVDPRADDDTVRKHYRKLALMLHPDKNKSVGADGAFKHVSEAWSILSDKARRAAYDEKINAKAQKGSTIFGGSSAKAAENGANNSNKKPPSSSRTQKDNAKEQTSCSINKAKSTFWTTCIGCKMQYEYPRMYLNLRLACLSCHGAFVASETNPPPASRIRPGAPLNFKPNPNHQGPHKSKSNAGKNNMAAPNVEAGSNKNSFQWAPLSNSGVSNVAQSENLVQQAYHKVKRDREEAQAATKKEEALRRKQNVSKKGYGNSAKRKRVGMEGNGASNSTRDLSAIELQNLLIDKARKEIRKQLNEFQANTVDKSVAEKSGDCFQKE